MLISDFNKTMQLLHTPFEIHVDVNRDIVVISRKLCNRNLITKSVRYKNGMIAYFKANGSFAGFKITHDSGYITAQQNIVTGDITVSCDGELIYSETQYGLIELFIDGCCVYHQ